MSLVNSFINQIGREIGKDVYRGLKTSVRSSGRSRSEIGVFFETNENNFKSKVYNFKPSTYDKVTMRNLSQLVSDSVNMVKSDDFDIHNIFAKIDDHIDNLKPFVDDKWKLMLEELDVKNQNYYLMCLKSHKNYIHKTMLDLENKVSNYSDPSGRQFLNPFFWIWISTIVWIYFNDSEKMTGYFVFGICAFVSFLLGNSKVDDIKKGHTSNIVALESCKNYLKTLESEVI